METGASSGAEQARDATKQMGLHEFICMEYEGEVPGRNHLCLIITLLLGLGLGCAEKVVLDVEVPLKNPCRAWKGILNKATSDGSVDYDLLESRPRPLKRYLAWVGEHGQHSDWWGESKEDRRIAHLANAHNAMVVHNILAHRPVASPDDIQVGLYRWPGAGMSRGVRYRLDGEWVNLHKLSHTETVARYQDPMLWLLFFDGSEESPPLQWWHDKKYCPPPKHQKALGLKAKLKKTLRALLETDAWLRRTETGMAAHPLFFEHEKDFLDWDNKENLCAWLLPHAKGARKAWLEDNQADCPLERSPPNRSLQQAD